MKLRRLLALPALVALAATPGTALAQAPAGAPLQVRYLVNPANLAAGESVKGPAPVLDLKGRQGINPTSIQTAHAENVRNYQWESYREMNNVRNDTGTAFSRKNPFAYRIGFGSAPAPFTINEWHKLHPVQIGGKVRGAIDGKVLLEFEDNSRTNTGAILNHGHIAIRCVVHSALVYRNLKVFTAPLPFAEVKKL